MKQKSQKTIPGFINVSLPRKGIFLDCAQEIAWSFPNVLLYSKASLARNTTAINTRGGEIWTLFLFVKFLFSDHVYWIPNLILAHCCRRVLELFSNDYTISHPSELSS